MPAIRFVYFDLGNVLVRFDPEIACRNLAKLAQVTPADARRVVYDSGLEDRYEAGELTPEEFVDSIVHQLECRVAPAEVLEATAAMFTLNTEVLPLVTRLAGAGLRMGILSNTCSSHWEWIVRRRWGIIPTGFTPCVLSYEVQSMKPAPAIYARAAESAQVAAEEILFLDDREENVRGAHAAGWRAIQYTHARDAARSLAELGLPIFV